MCLTEVRSDRLEHKHRQTDRQTDRHMREMVMAQAMSWSSLGLKRGSPRASGRTMSLPVLAAHLHTQLTEARLRCIYSRPLPYFERAVTHIQTHTNAREREQAFPFF